MTAAARLPLRSEPASRVSRREFHPSAAHRTVRDSHPSYGLITHSMHVVNTNARTAPDSLFELDAADAPLDV